MQTAGHNRPAVLFLEPCVAAPLVADRKTDIITGDSIRMVFSVAGALAAGL